MQAPYKMFRIISNKTAIKHNNIITIDFAKVKNKKNYTKACQCQGLRFYSTRVNYTFNTFACTHGTHA